MTQPVATEIIINMLVFLYPCYFGIFSVLSGLNKVYENEIVNIFEKNTKTALNSNCVKVYHIIHCFGFCDQNFRSKNQRPCKKQSAKRIKGFASIISHFRFSGKSINGLFPTKKCLKIKLLSRDYFMQKV
jgi:hypothetical protein